MLTNDLNCMALQGHHNVHRWVQSLCFAEGIVHVLESAEAERRAANGADSRKEEAAAERARKASKAIRDKKTGRKAAEGALQEDTSGRCILALSSDASAQAVTAVCMHPSTTVPCSVNEVHLDCVKRASSVDINIRVLLTHSLQA